MRKVDVAIVGAGQAGLATSYHLTQRGIEHVVFDRGRVGEAWRSRRWDSFALNAPNWAFALPGYKYDGQDPDAFMLREELAARFQEYARLIQAPVEEGVDVRRVAHDDSDSSYLLDTSAGPVQAKAVVAATGPYQRRNRPQNDLDPSILQLDSDTFRNAGQLHDGGALVVGSGQSGLQIAEDLNDAGRRVWLATGNCGWIPRRYRGKDNVAWRVEMGMFDDTVERLGHALRLVCPPMQTGVGGGHDVNLTILREEGIALTGRYEGAEGTTVYLADDLQANATKSDEAAVAFRSRVDEFIRQNGIDAPEAEPFAPAASFSDAPTRLDLRALDINNVIWATGFRLDFGWIDLDLDTRDGYPAQKQGVSAHPGLYFMGLQLMHTRKSGLIFGVGEDAEHISGVMAQQLGAA